MNNQAGRRFHRRKSHTHRRLDKKLGPDNLWSLPVRSDIGKLNMKQMKARLKLVCVLVFGVITIFLAFASDTVTHPVDAFSDGPPNLHKLSLWCRHWWYIHDNAACELRPRADLPDHGQPR